MSNEKTQLTPHLHKHYIKAWADGHTIYSRLKDSPNSLWTKVTHPSWRRTYEYATENELIHLNTELLPGRAVTAGQLYEEIIDLVKYYNQSCSARFLTLDSGDR